MSSSGSDELRSVMSDSFSSLSLESYKPTKDSPPPKGYPVAILQITAILKRFQCGICLLVLCQPTQGECGHQFCRNCIIYIISISPEQRVRCPVCIEEVSEEDIKYLTMFTVHYIQCLFSRVICDICGDEIAQKELSMHRLSKHRVDQKCPYGCDQEIDDANLKQHFIDFDRQHFFATLILLESFEQLYKRKILSPDYLQEHKRLMTIIDEREKAAKRIGEDFRQFRVAIYKQLRGEISDSTPSLSQEVTGLSQSQELVVNDASEAFTIYECIVAILSREIERLSFEYEAHDRLQRQDREKLEATEQVVKRLERSMFAKDGLLAEIDQRTTALELTSFDGVLFWRVTEFQRKRQEAVSQRVPSIYSIAFYTSHGGYKMCARLYLNGDGMGRGTHLSFFFVIMRGSFDALLKWPFNRKVTLIIIDQLDPTRNIQDSFRPDQTSSSFRRPSTEMNVASGCPMFMPITSLDNPEFGYVKDNTMFVKVIVSADEPT